MSKSIKFLKNLVHRINPSGTIENVSNRVDIQLENARHVAVQKYNDLMKNVNDSSMYKSVIQAAVKEPSPMPVHLVNWWRWYQKITGLEDVESAQHQVMIVQNNLFDCQARRRELNYEATEMNDKVKQIYSELLQTRRDDPKYVQLTILENKGLQEQVKIFDKLKLLDNEEKDLFTHLATSIKEYHDKQTMNAQKYKYLSIFATSLMAIVSLCASTMYNNKRIRDLRTAVVEAQEHNDLMFRTYFQSMDEKMSEEFARIDKNLAMSMKKGNNDVMKVVPVPNNNRTVPVHNLDKPSSSPIETIAIPAIAVCFGLMIFIRLLGA